MKIILVLLLMILQVSAKTQSISCNCTATTMVSHQQRSNAKHVNNFVDFNAKTDTINVNYIYPWQRKYSTVTQTITTNPLSQRKKKTPEDSLYILKGYMWFVKQEGNDCDFHIEIGPKNSNGTRIVVEVPQENTALQDKIKQKLSDLQLFIMGCNTQNSTKAHFKQGLLVVVTGLGFYDASHKPNTNHGDAHTKIYSWELHPVQDIEFLE